MAKPNIFELTTETAPAVILSLLKDNLTKEECVHLAEHTMWWTACSEEAVAVVHLRQSRLCAPFSVFHAGIEKLVGRPVWTHEIALCSSEFEAIADKWLIDNAETISRGVKTHE
ncbi:MAG: hypothetical protein FWB93_03355 [Oscillospiraceae bacterium]|nr:hypothetical protein [Oscillospiraceae bacterium]